jgi:bacterioferritin-associated ferredoxin
MLTSVRGSTEPNKRDMYVCICKGIREEDVRNLGRSGPVTASQVVSELGLDSAQCCGRCLRTVDRFVRLANDADRLPEPAIVSASTR